MPFDYIHTRVTSGCWSNFKEQIADQAFETLRPGGWFESQEYDANILCDDGTLPLDGHLSTWFREINEASELMGRPTNVAASLRDAYIEAGFIDVQVRIFKMPMNGWPKDERLKELGRMWERNFLMGLSGFSFTLFNRIYERTPAQIEVSFAHQLSSDTTNSQATSQVSLVDVRRELIDTRIHAYIPVHVIIGRKPFPGEMYAPRASFT